MQMMNAFSRYEQHFQQWTKSGYSECSEKTADYLEHLSDPEDPSQPREGTLWPHQWDCLLRMIYAYEIEPSLKEPSGVLLNVVTGGGKTAVIAAAMAWLRLAHDVKMFVVICPNLIVRDRLEEDFRNGKVFEDRGLLPPDGLIKKDDFDLTTLGGVGGAGAGLWGSSVVMGNIHQFYQDSGRGRRNTAKLMNGPDFALFNDEAHNSPAPQWERALEVLSAKTLLRVDTTATPERADGQTPGSKMICEYRIDDALSERLVKTPVVYQPNIRTVELTYTDEKTGETRCVKEIDWEEVDRMGLNATQWVTDDKPMQQQTAIALKRLEEQERRAKGRYQPLLFVVAVSKLDAKKAQQMLTNFFKIRTLLVTEDSPEEDRQTATELNKQKGKNPYKAVVSVLMLREGWDMPEVGVILLLRKFGSRVYGQQVIGRGLRRVRRPDIDAEEPQICAVVDHPKLEHGWLWDIFQPKIRADVEIDQTFDETEDLPEPPPRQELLYPERLIEIPDAVHEEFEEFEIEIDRHEAKPLENWREVLANLEYERETPEITDVKTDSVVGKELKKDGWTTKVDPPEELADFEVHMSQEDLADGVKEALMAAAERLLEHAGHSLQFKGRIYSILLGHIRERFLNGASLGLSSKRQLETARRALPRMEKAVKDTPGLVEGMVRYGNQ